MNNKKGFTLIELLAVIVILAVIALIATPLIMNVIDEAKKGAAKNSANGVIEAGALKLAHDIESVTSGAFQGKTYTETSNLEFKGTKPSKFTLTFNGKGEAEFKGFISGYCITKSFENSEVEIDESKKTADDCVNGGAKVFANGEAIYFDPSTGKSCNNYVEANSLNENKTGCLKWYAFNDTKENDSVSIILDHNTTAALTSLGVDDELNALKQNADWKYTPTLIRLEELARIVGLDISDPILTTGFYLETQTQEMPSFVDMENPGNAQGKAKYTWLFDYTKFCIGYGCNKEDDKTFGYLVDSSNISDVKAMGVVYSAVFPNDGLGLGIRPVIEVPKSILNVNG